MKKVVLLALVALVFAGWKQTQPSEVARQFVTSLYLLDYTGAAELASSDTKSFVNEKTAMPLEKNGDTRSSRFQQNDFLLDSLKETINGNTATVQSDGTRISLVKEENKWKVVASPALVSEVVNRTEKTNEVAARWDALQNGLKNRMDAVRQYLEYQSQAGSLSADGQALLELIANATLPENFSRKDQEVYLQQQKQIGELASKTVVPTYTANADLTLSLIIRINEADRNIESAKEAYNKEAAGLQSPRWMSSIGE